jgi:hypothetical protein
MIAGKLRLPKLDPSPMRLIVERRRVGSRIVPILPWALFVAGVARLGSVLAALWLTVEGALR